jgi:hypothetical protein
MAMSLKRDCKKAVEDGKKWIHELAIEGEFDCMSFEPRKGWMVTLTYAKYGDVLQGVGTSFFNPADENYYSGAGYSIARGNAEVALGARLLVYNDFFGDTYSSSRIVRLVLDAAHRVRGDCKWKDMTKPASMRPKSLPARYKQLKQAISSVLTLLPGMGVAPVEIAIVQDKPFSDNGGTSNTTQDAQCAERKEQQENRGSAQPVSVITPSSWLEAYGNLQEGILPQE